MRDRRRCSLKTISLWRYIEKERSKRTPIELRYFGSSEGNSKKTPERIR